MTQVYVKVVEFCELAMLVHPQLYLGGVCHLCRERGGGTYFNLKPIYLFIPGSHLMPTCVTIHEVRLNQLRLAFTGVITMIQTDVIICNSGIMKAKPDLTALISDVRVSPYGILVQCIY